jgi:hypothetical protein
MGDHEGTLITTDMTADELKQLVLAGTTPDTLDAEVTFYDPDGDRDGIADTGCPDGFDALLEGNDGWLYGANSGSNPGVWRIYNDAVGPREVSAPGSPFHLTVDKSLPDLIIGWENLGPLDAGRPPHHAGQHAEAYQIWEGTLPIAGAYDHTSLATADGTADGPGRLTWTGPPSSGDRYYLVSAQNENLEGSLGRDSGGQPRSSPIDYCDTLGWGTDLNECAEEWKSPIDGSKLDLIDYNPNSPTYLQAINISDYRGKVVKMDISARNCSSCGVMALDHHYWDEQFGDRDFQIITIMMDSYFTWAAINPQLCSGYINAWAANYGETTPILCDVDLDGDGNADVASQYDIGCGTPQNIFVDQGQVIYNQVCGAIYEDHPPTPPGQLYPYISGEINPETCE